MPGRAERASEASERSASRRRAKRADCKQGASEASERKRASEASERNKSARSARENKVKERAKRAIVRVCVCVSSRRVGWGVCVLCTDRGLFFVLFRGYNLLMATVTLPFGYPALEGMEYSVLVYQGTAVRVYTGATDPRTDSQLFQRKINSDLAKMRKTLGTFGRNVCKIGMGSAWSTVLFQFLKADINGWWSDLGARWASMNETDKSAWRSAAPYTATFNDMGEVFFKLACFLAEACLEFSGSLWGLEDWEDNQATDALAWWVRSVDSYKGEILGKDWEHDEGWTPIVNFLYANGSGVAEAWTYFYGKTFNIVIGSDDGLGEGQVYVDGELVFDGATSYSIPVGVALEARALVFIRVVKTSSTQLIVYRVID